MFRATHRSSPGALVFAASGFFTHVVTGRCQDGVEELHFATQPWQRPVTTWAYKPEAANTV
jgi:hypothetical protein